MRKKCKVGYRTIKMYLERSYGLTVNHKKILLSMRLQGLRTTIRRNRYKSVNMVESTLERAFSDKVKRAFSPSKPDSIYSGDITEFRISGGLKIYLYAAKDLCTKEIVSYNVGTSPSIELVTTNLREKLEKLPEEVREKLIYHTDQGGVFMSDTHISLTKKLRVNQSMSRRGNCLDNSPIESFFGHFKDELDYKKLTTFKEVQEAIDNYIWEYNNERPQWSLKRKTPAECRSLLL